MNDKWINKSKESSMAINPYFTIYGNLEDNVEVDSGQKLWHMFDNKLITHDFWDLNMKGTNYCYMWHITLLDCVCKCSDIYYLEDAIKKYNWVYQTNDFGMDALSCACQIGNMSAIKCIIKYHPNINHLDCRGYNALAHLIFGYNPSIEMIDILLEYGFDLDGKTGEDQTVLHLACIRSNWSIIEFLLEKGMCIYTRDKYSNTAFSYCNLHIVKDDTKVENFRPKWNPTNHRYVDYKTQEFIIMILWCFQGLPKELIIIILEYTIIMPIL